MAITDLDEQLLVRAHQAGDEHAFGQIVRSQHRALYAHAYRRLGSHEAAEDAVQDTLLRAYRALPSFDGDLRLRAWLHRILTNVCHDESNRRKRASGLIDRLESQPVELAPDPIEETILHDTVRVMNEALAELPDSYREALVLRYVDGLSFKEVGEVTGISEENARARVHRGRQALNKVLSRIAVLAAFLIPGLRRAQQTSATPGPEQAAAADHVTLVTQLTSHAMNAAPAVTRVASEMSALPSGKSALITGAIAAAAAVSVPVAAYTVHEATTPQKRAPAVAAPAETTTDSTEAPITGSSLPATDGSVKTVAPGTTPESTTSTTLADGEVLPPSVADPFAEVEDDTGTPPSESSTTSTTQPPSSPSAPLVSGQVTADDLVATGTGPNVDLAGAVTLTDGRPADLTGRLSIYDDGVVSGELELVVDGVTHALRLRGSLVEGSPGQHFAGKFSMPTGDQFGFPVAGDLTAGSLERNGDRASLVLNVEGEERSS